MSDSRRRSSRKSSSNTLSSSSAADKDKDKEKEKEKPATSSSSSSSSRRHGSARHSSSGASSSSRSAASLNRLSSGSSQSKSRESLVANATASSQRVYSSSSRAASSTSLQQQAIPELDPAPDPVPAPAPAPSVSSGGGDGIYQNTATANDSRFSLTDQFASTRSVLDFGFDDSASSIFDAQSIFSAGSSNYGGGYSRRGSRPPSIYGGAGVDTSGFGMAGGLDPFPELASSLARVAASEALTGSPWQSDDDYLGGSYSTVRDVAEDDDDTATVGEFDDDDADKDDTSTNQGGYYTPQTSRSRAPSSAQVTVIEASGHTDGWSAPAAVHMLAEDQATPLPDLELASSVSTETEHQTQPTQKQQLEHLEQLENLEQLEQLELRPPLHPSVDLAFVIPVYRTHYELLGLSREQLTASLPMASVEDRIDFDVRFAFYRLFRLFNSSISNGSSIFTSSTPDSFSPSQPITSNLMPESLRPVVRRYFMEIENAYATLIDPVQRLEYNRFLDDLEDEIAAKNGYLSEDDDDDEDAEDAEDTDKSTASPKNFPAPVRSAFVRRNDFQTTTDLGVRYVVTGGGRGDAGVDGSTRSLLPSAPDLTSLDYSLTQTVRFGLPGMRVHTQNGLVALQKNITLVRNMLKERYSHFRRHQIVARQKQKNKGHRRSLSAAADTVDAWTAPRCGVPVLTLSASAYALSTAPAFAASPEILPPLGDRYQPLLSEVLGPARIAQLVRARASGCVVVGYRQEFWTQGAMAAAIAEREAAGPASSVPWPPPPTFIVDVETEVLPRLAMTTRISHSIPTLPASVRKAETRLFGAPSSQPVHVEVMVQGAEPVSLWGATSPPLLSTLVSTLTGRAPMPRLGLGVSRRVGAKGNFFLCADSGNTWWSLSSSSSSLLAPFLPPMVEVGYNIGPHELGMHAGNPLTGPSDRGLKGVDIDMNSLARPADPASSAGKASNAVVAPHGTWTISTATTGLGLGSMATYVRYGRTVFLTPLWRSPPAHMSANAQKRARQHHTMQRAVRIEAELCSADSLLPSVLSVPSSDGYLAVRVLAPFRWWGIRSGWASNTATGFASTTPASTTPPKLGIEIALSGGGSGLNGGHGALHVSLYWSRMGQRLKLPFLFLPTGGASSLSAGKLFFWAAVAPAAVMAVRELARIYWRSFKLRFKAVQKRRKAKKDLAKGIAATTDHEYDEAKDEAKDEDDSFVFDEMEDRVITRHRAEADELTMILATSVDAQKLLERKMVNAAPGRDAAARRDDESPRDDELVILSAKYGVALTDDDDDGSAGPAPIGLASRNGWAPDYEVADVTAAVSALVVAADSGMDASVAHVVNNGSGNKEQQYVWRGDRLVIPRGLRKNRILGFWDPAPSFERKQREQRERDRDQGRPPRRAKGKKVLHVRYLWKGQERIAEVGERQELRLPSYDDLEGVGR